MQTNTAIQHRLLSVSDYYTMAKSGIFKDDERVELINGELFYMSPIGCVHVSLVTRLSRLFMPLAAKNEILMTVQSPVFLNDFSSPEPDISLLKPRADDYMQSLPSPKDVLLLIEVADTSLHYDSKIKLPLYARHKIPEIWLLDAQNNELNIYQQPFKNGYQSHYRPKAGELVQPLLIESVSVDWEKLFVF